MHAAASGHIGFARSFCKSKIDMDVNILPMDHSAEPTQCISAQPSAKQGADSDLGARQLLAARLHAKFRLAGGLNARSLCAGSWLGWPLLGRPCLHRWPFLSRPCLHGRPLFGGTRPCHRITPPSRWLRRIRGLWRLGRMPPGWGALLGWFAWRNGRGPPAATATHRHVARLEQRAILARLGNVSGDGGAHSSGQLRQRAAHAEAAGLPLDDGDHHRPVDGLPWRDPGANGVCRMLHRRLGRSDSVPSNGLQGLRRCLLRCWSRRPGSSTISKPSDEFCSAGRLARWRGGW